MKEGGKNRRRRGRARARMTTLPLHLIPRHHTAIRHPIIHSRVHRLPKSIGNPKRKVLNSNIPNQEATRNPVTLPNREIRERRQVAPKAKIRKSKIRRSKIRKFRKENLRQSFTLWRSRLLNNRHHNQEGDHQRRVNLHHNEEPAHSDMLAIRTNGGPAGSLLNVSFVSYAYSIRQDTVQYLHIKL